MNEIEFDEVVKTDNGDPRPNDRDIIKRPIDTEGIQRLERTSEQPELESLGYKPKKPEKPKNDINIVLLQTCENLITLTKNALGKLYTSNDIQEEAKSRALMTLGIWEENTLRMTVEAFE